MTVISKFNPNIHGLRGLAAVFVFILHLYHGLIPFLSEYNLISNDLILTIKSMLSVGSSGVDIFFIISGYLITASLAKHRNVKSFLLDRCIRIYPVFLSIHIPFFLIMPFLGWKWLDGVSFVQWSYLFVTNLLFLPGVFDLKIAQTNAWTLSYEMFFYLTSALFFCFSINFNSRLKYWFFASVLLAIFWFFPRSAYFLVGVIVYFTLTSKPSLIANFNFYPSLMFLLFILLLGPFRSSMPLVGYAIHAQDIYTKIALIPAFFFFIQIIKGSGFISSVLRTRFFQFLGTISYSLYLWHAVVLYVTTRFISKFIALESDPSIVIVLFIIITILLTLLISWLSFFFIEKHLTRLIKYKIKS